MSFRADPEQGRGGSREIPLLSDKGGISPLVRRTADSVEMTSEGKVLISNILIYLN